jgi:phosphoribosyl 1,2-cyclic phosphodiesterase
MKVKFWGVRGSIPCPGPSTQKFGGNTTCLQILGGSDTIIVDAGTGIRELGHELMKKSPVRVHLLVTHTHWDHIQGFPFFSPIYHPGNEIFIYGPRTLEKTLEEAILFQMQYTYFPVRGVELAALVKFTQLDEQSFTLGDVRVTTKSMNHPIRVLAYKFEKGGRTALYTGDNEPYYDVMLDRAGRLDGGIHRRAEFIEECNQQVQAFCAGSDLLIADCQYTDDEYATKRGWGHSSVSHVVDLATAARVKRVALFHHEPTHDDHALEAIERNARAVAKRSKGLHLFLAREGMTVDV